MQRGIPTKEEIKVHFHTYAHVQDAPAIFFWEKLLETYPDAKVVMTTREFESWHKSVNDTIGTMMRGSPNRPLGITIAHTLIPRLRRHGAMMESTWTHNPKYLNGDLSKESMRKFHEIWYKTVPEICPKDKLLIFDVK